jgi:hypothetical protein
MVTALAQHLAGNGVLDAGLLVDVKITGINWDNEETILPSASGGNPACDAGNACLGGVCTESDVLGMLTDAGYSEATLEQAFLTFAGIFRAAFPGVPIGAQVSPALPRPVGISGSASTPVDLAFLDAGASLGPLTAQDQGLTAVSPPDPGVSAVWAAGSAVAYQELDNVAGAKRCVMAGPSPDAGPCNESVLCEAIDNGIDNGHSQWLELYVQDVVGFPDAGAYAHTRLVDGAPAGGCP